VSKVQPYEKEDLADPMMQFDYEEDEFSVREHMLEAQEGSRGGFGPGGGGCGCN